MRPATRAQDGFTLVEVLVSISITGVILGAIVSATYFGLRTTTDQRRSLEQSNAEQLLATWFTADVQSACDPSLTTPSCTRNPNPSTSSGSACGVTALFALDSVSSPLASAPDTTTAYVLQNGTLTRRTCDYGSTSVTSNSTLATDVSSATVSYPTSGSCSGRFQLAVTLAGSTLGNGTSAYPFTLCAQRRA